MSLLSLFTSSAPKSTQSDVRAGFMGKISTRPDFVRHQAGLPEIKALEQWMFEGIAYLGKRSPAHWKERLESFTKINFYMAGEGSSPAVSGVITASQDASGRQHPFVEFAASQPLVLKQSLPYISLQYSDFYTQAGALRSPEGKALDIDELIQKNTQLASRLDKFDETALVKKRNEIWAGKTQVDFWEKVLPQASQNARLNFTRDVLQTLKLAAGRGPERVAWGVRLPIAGGADNSALVSFWLTLFVKALEGHSWRPHVLWNSPDKHGASLMLYFRTPNPSGFAQMLCQEVDEGGVVDVVRRPLENLPEVTQANLKKMLGSEPMSWNDMLENWIKG